MKFTGYLQSWLSPIANKSTKNNRFVSINRVGRPLWTPRDYRSLTNEGYTRNVIVYRCISLISKGIASVPWTLYHKDRQLLDHPLLDLLGRPNPSRGGARFMEAMVGYLLLSGNSYVEVVKSVQNKPLELHTLRPDRIKVIPGDDGVPEGYEYSVNGRSRRINNEYSNVLHIKNFHPLNDWYGMSPIEAAAYSIDQFNAVGSHNLSVLQNGGRPSGALVVGTSEHARPLSDEQKDNLRQDIQSLYSGERNAGKVMLLEGDFQWQEMGLSPKDLDFIEGKNLSAREIAQAYGVPPMLVGIQGDATYANYKEARFHLWEDTILPLLDSLNDEFNRWLVPQYERDLILSHDLDGIPALAPRREATWKKIEGATFLTINEKRSCVGYGPLKGGDVINQKELENDTTLTNES